MITRSGSNPVKTGLHQELGIITSLHCSVTRQNMVIRRIPAPADHNEESGWQYNSTHKIPIAIPATTPTYIAYNSISISVVVTAVCLFLLKYYYYYYYYYNDIAFTDFQSTNQSINLFAQIW